MIECSWRMIKIVKGSSRYQIMKIVKDIESNWWRPQVICSLITSLLEHRQYESISESQSHYESIYM